MEERARDSTAGASHSPINRFFIMVIIAIVGASIVGYVILQGMSEEQVRASVYDQYRQRQITYASSLAANIQSDLELLMGKLETVALSGQAQGGDLSSPDLTLLLQRIHEEANRISEVDGVFIADKDSTIVNYYNPSIEGSGVVGVDISDYPPTIEHQNNLPDPTFSSAYRSPVDGSLRISLTYPIYSSATAEYMGSASMVLILESFFGHYGNTREIDSQYLAALDSKGTVLTSAASDIVGMDVFSDYVYDQHIDKSAYDHYRAVMGGSKSVASFGFKSGDRLNVGEPIILNGVPTYSLFVVTPNSAINPEIDSALTTFRIETFLFLGIISAAVSLSIFFLLRWNKDLSTAVRSRTRELEEANDKLAAQDKLQKEFINIAAHELRTPIQPLLGVTELIEKGMDGKDRTEVTREDVEMLSRNAKRLERLSLDLLEASRMESGTLKLNKEKVDLDEKIRNIIKDVKSFVPHDHNVQIVYDKTTEPLVIEADRARIFEVLSNILRNAIKFTEEGTIRITAESKEGNAIVKISDTGTGIDPEIFPNLFTKFATKSDQGTGLGLYISKGIIEAHGGKIWAENNEGGKGATFIFTIPIAKEPTTV